MVNQPDKVQLRHPDSKKVAPRIDKDKYDVIRAALLKAIPDNEQGVPFEGLDVRVAKLLSKTARYNISSIGWYTAGVKLDLEAQGLIERVPGSQPQRLRRVKAQVSN